MMPELLAAMLSVEALEDNEILKIEGVRLFSRISDKTNKGKADLLDEPKTVRKPLPNVYEVSYKVENYSSNCFLLQVTVCLMDAEDYKALPLGQWEEDNVLRELNKSLLAFQQTPMKGRDNHRIHERRLSPIGKISCTQRKINGNRFNQSAFGRFSGESFSHTPPEVEATVMIKQASSCSTINSYNSRSPSPQNYCAATLNLNDPSK